MKSKKPSVRSLLNLGTAALIAIAPAAYAKEGGSSGGGGTYVVIDGRTQIADPYYAGRPVSQVQQITLVKFSDFPKEIRDYLVQTQEFLLQLIPSNYDDTLLKPLNWTLKDFFEKVVTNPDQRYFLVPKDREDNVPCEKYLPTLNHPVSAHFQYGCTFNGDTYLFIDKWKQASLEEQAFALLHERLWAYRPNADQKDVTAFVGGAQILERRYQDQIIRGDRSAISATDVKALQELFNASYRLEFLDTSENVEHIKGNYQVLNGGGLLFQSKSKNIAIDENSFIGLGTSIFAQPDSEIHIKNSAVIGSTLFAENNDPIELTDCEILNSATSKGAKLTRVVAKNLSVIKHSQLNDSLVDDSLLESITAEHSQVTHSLLEADEKNQSRVTYADISHADIQVVRHEINGSKNLPVRISDVRFSWNTLILDEGGILENVRLLIGDQISTVTSLRIGQQSVLRNLVYFINSSKKPDAYYYLGLAALKPAEVTVEKDTSVSNGVLSFALDCWSPFDPPIARIYIGRSDNPYQRDLGGNEVMVPRSSGCSARFDN